MNSVDFRKELMKIMPGYSWTVHKQNKLRPGRLDATGIQSSGFNRLSTLMVTRTEQKDGRVWYEVKSAAHGTKTPWAHETGDVTLARALRELQKHYEQQSSHFRVLADRLENGRRAVAELESN